LEEKAANFFETDTSVVLPSGYLSNSVLAQSISDEFNIIFIDEKAHPSLVDAANMACYMRDKKLVRFKSMNTQSLDDQLKKHLNKGSRPLIMTDGVFAADGGIPPLNEYVQVINDYDGKILLDDAHAMAVVGKLGKGSWEEMGIDREMVYQTGTLSKGFGVFGGIITGDSDLAETIYKKSMAFVGSTGLSLPLAAAGLYSISHLLQNRAIITQLQERAIKLKKKFRDIGFNMPETTAPIFSISHGEVNKNTRLKKLLFKNNIYPPFMNYPGAPDGGHFRFIITSLTTEDQINLLYDTIKSSL
jgi:7-keto-8-aminopelargonate synthetase-like enzyme